MKRTFTFRVDDSIWKKFCWLADLVDRSANNQLEVLVKKWVADYEKENGEIDPDSD